VKRCEPSLLTGCDCAVDGGDISEGIGSVEGGEAEDGVL
jgi:hypothetical protein